jgi:TetR/AcrR family transcriptional regulator, ethionamide resistance regulator
MAVTQGHGAGGADRRSREGNADTRGQILSVTEKLLEQLPLQDLSVAQIIDRAEISRATFYFYFSSKFDVVVGMLARIMDDVYELGRPFLDQDAGISPEDALARSVRAAARAWRTHRFALRAMSEHWNTVPELRTMWLSVVERFTSGIAAEIERERAVGLARDGIDARELAATLLWATERAFYVAGLEIGSPLRSEEEAVPAVLAIWRGAIYGA